MTLSAQEPCTHAYWKYFPRTVNLTFTRAIQYITLPNPRPPQGRI
jgi:hypothetical protein